MNSFQKIIIYLKMFAKAMIRNPSFSTFKGSIKNFSNWWRHLNEGRNSVSDNMPWLTFDAINFLKKVLQPAMVVFEYGSGGSTLFWAKHATEVVSIEHDRLWYDRMAIEFLNRRIGNVQYILAEAEDDETTSTKSYTNPRHYVSEDPNFTKKNFERYVKQIEHFPDQSFDIIIIDGRARPSCILHSLSKLKKDGYLVVDNSERNYYLSPFQFNTSDWKIWKFFGPVPYNYDFSETTIFKKITID